MFIFFLDHPFLSYSISGFPVKYKFDIRVFTSVTSGVHKRDIRCPAGCRMSRLWTQDVTLVDTQMSNFYLSWKLEMLWPGKGGYKEKIIMIFAISE